LSCTLKRFVLEILSPSFVANPTFHRSSFLFSIYVFNVGPFAKTLGSNQGFLPTL